MDTPLLTRIRGAGAYLIEGRGNGGVLVGLLLGLGFSAAALAGAMIIFSMVTAGISLILFLTFVLAIALAVFSILLMLAMHNHYSNVSEKAGSCFLGGLGLGFLGAIVPKAIWEIFVQLGAIKTSTWAECKNN